MNQGQTSAHAQYPHVPHGATGAGDFTESIQKVAFIAENRYKATADCHVLGRPAQAFHPAKELS